MELWHNLTMMLEEAIGNIAKIAELARAGLPSCPGQSVQRYRSGATELGPDHRISYGTGRQRMHRNTTMVVNIDACISTCQTA